MFRFRTLTQRFGAIYALIAVLLLGVSIVVTVHLRNMTVDSGRVMEEAREQTITARLITEIDALRMLLQDPDGLDPGEVERASELLGRTRRDLAMLTGAHDDPSRDEHQKAEGRLNRSLDAELDAVERVLQAPDEQVESFDAVGALGHARHYAEVLLAEAQEEAREADEDLEHRARSTGMILAGTWLASLVLLVVALVLTQRGIVQPLRRMRTSTERFGRGERDHRVRVEDPDELGSLARAFNHMADTISSAQDDLEERVRERTAQFLRAARLADLGLLASGIAHELNTPLASIASSAEGLQRKAAGGEVAVDVVREYSRTISDEAFRARDISTRMLALVREERSEVSTVPLDVVRGQALSAVRHRAESRGIELRSKAVSAAISVRVNGGELVQILVNLLANAIDASEPGGRVELGVASDGETLTATVADDGEGIRAEDLERVFEPFFSTKRPGAGTGLGLALVATLVESHGGRVSVRSEPGEGATFTVTLPADWSKAP